MRILIHAVALKKTGGSSQHLRNFLSALCDVGSEHEYYLCLDERFTYSGPQPPGEIIPISGLSPLKRLWWDQVGVSRLVKERNIDVILSLLTFGPLNLPVPHVNFQRTPVYFFEQHLKNLVGYRKYITLLRRSLLKWVMKGSDAIVTPSVAMRDAILRVFPELHSRRFVVIPHGFDKAGFKRSLSQYDRGNARVESNSPTRILYVSHFLPHKNFEIIPPVARRLAERGLDFQFRFTGSREDWPLGYDRMMQKAGRLDVEGYLVPLGRVPHGQIAEVYTQADLFFFPSLCESFGFPMVEAMGGGLPIVAADTSINKEICDNAALYYKAEDPDDASEQLMKLITNPKHQQELGGNALKRFDDWVLDMRQYAIKVLNLLETVISGHSNR